MKEKVVIFRETQCSHTLCIWFLSPLIFRETQCSHTLCIWFLSPPLYSNILARGGSLFLKSCLCNN